MRYWRPKGHVIDPLVSFPRERASSRNAGHVCLPMAASGRSWFIMWTSSRVGRPAGVTGAGISDPAVARGHENVLNMVMVDTERGSLHTTLPGFLSISSSAKLHAGNHRVAPSESGVNCASSSLSLPKRGGLSALLHRDKHTWRYMYNHRITDTEPQTEANKKQTHTKWHTSNRFSTQVFTPLWRHTSSLTTTSPLPSPTKFNILPPPGGLKMQFTDFDGMTEFPARWLSRMEPVLMNRMGPPSHKIARGTCPGSTSDQIIWVAVGQQGRTDFGIGATHNYYTSEVVVSETRIPRKHGVSHHTRTEVADIEKVRRVDDLQQVILEHSWSNKRLVTEKTHSSTHDIRDS